MSLLKRAGLGLGASAILHVVGVPFMGVPFLVVALIYAALGYALWREMRLVPCVAFVIALGGSLAAFSGVLGGTPLPIWLSALILIADLFAVAMLFVHIWKGRADTVAGRA